MSRRIFLLYDGRACGGVVTDRALVLAIEDTDREARSTARQDFGDCACFSYRQDREPTKMQESRLTDERWEWDYTAATDTFSGRSDRP